ncbi:MAG TPA: hypothetical protein VMV87_01240 [Burkholderiales bacterium]|nr:hypothetical protein [Burkholderiales bacterium]
MNALVFNACLLIGWLMALAGGCLVNPAYGLLGGGLLLLLLTILMARMGGIYQPRAKT